MNLIRTIIKEEIETLWGMPIPKKGEKGYRPAIHNLEMVNNRASNKQLEVRVYEDVVEDIRQILAGPANSDKERVNRALLRIDSLLDELAKLYREWDTPY